MAYPDGHEETSCALLGHKSQNCELCAHHTPAIANVFNGRSSYICAEKRKHEEEIEEESARAWSMIQFMLLPNTIEKDQFILREWNWIWRNAKKCVLKESQIVRVSRKLREKERKNIVGNARHIATDDVSGMQNTHTHELDHRVVWCVTEKAIKPSVNTVQSQHMYICTYVGVMPGCTDSIRMA